MACVIRIGLIGIVLAVLVLPSEPARRAPDLMGSYCGSRPPRSQCCKNRADNCAVPLMGTKCYCDQFCNHGYNEDCCPDYWEVCLGEAATPAETVVRSCHFEGRQYPSGATFTSNCNKCTCVDGSRRCDVEVCVVDQPLLDLLRRMRPTLGWTAANYTFFWGRKLSEALLRRGGTPHPHGAITLAAKNTAVMHANGEPVPSTPESFDARSQWPGLVGDLPDQGWCDTAWALTTASVASDRLAIQTRGARRDRLSPQELIDCSRSLQSGCDVGGHLDRAWNYMRRKGISPERCYQWTGTQDKCRANPGRCKPYRTGPVYPLPGEELIRYDIYTSGPVQATMKLYRDFFSYRSGIYRRSPESKSHRTGFHVVKIVGWGEENGEKYWIAANSWGPTWGERGYFRIVRGSNECEIENYVLAAWGPPLGNFTTRSPSSSSNDLDWPEW